MALVRTVAMQQVGCRFESQSLLFVWSLHVSSCARKGCYLPQYKNMTFRLICPSKLLFGTSVCMHGCLYRRPAQGVLCLLPIGHHRRPMGQRQAPDPLWPCKDKRVEIINGWFYCTSVQTFSSRIVNGYRSVNTNIGIVSISDHHSM